MSHWLVRMPMTVRFRAFVAGVLMVVMIVMRVFVLMVQRFMAVCVLVALGQHEPCRERRQCDGQQ